MKKTYKIYTTLAFILLYAPLLIMVFFSFNSTESTGVFTGFSLKWYKSLFEDADGSIKSALMYSITLAVISSLVATFIGTLAALGISKFRKKYIKNAIVTVTNIPMVNPEIVTAVSIVLLFSALFTIFKIKIGDFASLLIAHITFNLPYVVLSVMPKIKQMDGSLTEAAMDLGCTPAKAFFKIELPQIMPGIFSGLIMAFTMSFDDFVISHFTAGTIETLPLKIYSMTGKGSVTPDMYALSTFMMIAILLMLILSNLVQSKDERAKNKAMRALKQSRLKAAKGGNQK
jgi:spermidine/putrescine transport system permease protein